MRALACQLKVIEAVVRCTVSDGLLCNRDVSSRLGWISKQDPEDLLMQKSEQVVSACSHNCIVSVIGLHNLVLVTVDVEKAHIEIRGGCGSGVALSSSLRINDSCLTRLALGISHLNCAITLYSVASLHTVTRLVKHSFVTDVLVPHSCVLIEIKR